MATKQQVPDNSLAIWSQLARTDPDHTKAFQRAGGFRGTAIKPIYSIQRMTEEFGPCGHGWGMGEPQFTTVQAGEEVAVHCTLRLWYMHSGGMCELYGVGGDMAVKALKDGRRVIDDEAYKKAYTDALTNAMKHLGMSADVHMGLFDDSKYVAELRREHQNGHAEPAPAPDARPRAGKTPEQFAKAVLVADTAKLAALDNWLRKNGALEFGQERATGLAELVKQRHTMLLTDPLSELDDIDGLPPAGGPAA